MSKRSVNSDSQNRERTPITGQSGKLPREGIISEEIGTEKAVPNGNRARTAAGESTSQTSEFKRVASQTGAVPVIGRRPAKFTLKQKARRVMRRAKRTFFTVLYNVLTAIIEHKRVAAVSVACLLTVCISIPVAVYAAEKNDDSSPDIALVDSASAESGEVILSDDFEVGVFMQSDSDIDPDEKGDGAESADPEDTSTSEEEKSEDGESSAEADSTASESNETETDATVMPPDNTFAVTIYFYDRESVTCMTGPAKLRDILSAAGIALLNTDRITVDLDTVIEGACAIGVDSVEYRTVTVSEPIPFNVDTYNVQFIPRGTTQVAGNGVNGAKDSVYTVEYLNGVEVSRVKEYDYIASYPINQVNYYGTGGTFTAPDGSVLSFSYVIECKATYYNIHGTTATGLPTGDNIVAVDPSVIPLGSNVYIMNERYDMGYRIAADTGGAVIGNFIDIWMDVGSPNYEQFSFQGVDYMQVYVLD